MEGGTKVACGDAVVITVVHCLESIFLKSIFLQIGTWRLFIDCFLKLRVTCPLLSFWCKGIWDGEYITGCTPYFVTNQCCGVHMFLMKSVMCSFRPSFDNRNHLFGYFGKIWYCWHQIFIHYLVKIISSGISQFSSIVSQ